MTVPRSRMGSACTEWKPAASASGANRGQRPSTVGQVLVHDRLAGAVAVEARAFLGLQLEQLQHAHGLAGGGHHPQVAVGRDQHEPGRGDVEHVDAAVGEQRQQLDHVEVGDERVGQLHERPGEHRFSRHRDLPSRRPRPARFRPSERDRGPSYDDPDGRRAYGRADVGLTARGPSRRSGRRSAASGHHVSGDVGEGTVVAEGVGPQPDERLADADVELGGDHARGLVHHVLEVGARLQLGGERPRRRVRPAAARTAWAATSAMTSASACWSSVSGPGRSQYRLSAPRRTAPTWSGKPKTARTPASSAGPVNASHRGVSGRPDRVRARAGPGGRRPRRGLRRARTAAAR